MPNYLSRVVDAGSGVAPTVRPATVAPPPVVPVVQDRDEDRPLDTQPFGPDSTRRVHAQQTGQTGTPSPRPGERAVPNAVVRAPRGLRERRPPVTDMSSPMPTLVSEVVSPRKQVLPSTVSIPDPPKAKQPTAEPRPAAGGNQQAFVRPERSVSPAAARDAASDFSSERESEKGAETHSPAPPALVLATSGPKPTTATGETAVPTPARESDVAVPPARPWQPPTRRVTIGQVEVQVINQPSTPPPRPLMAPADRLGKAPNFDVNLERFRFRL